MSDKKKNKKKPFSDFKNDVIIRNSFYTFSKEYPVSSVMRDKSSGKRKKAKRNLLKGILMALLVVAVTLSSFIIFDAMLKLSMKTPEKNTARTESAEGRATENILDSVGIQALYLPGDRLSDDRYIKSFIRSVRKKDCNCAVIDFKDKNGRLLFSSKNNLALVSKCAMYDNETVHNTLKKLTDAGIKVVARVFCFEDPLIAENAPELAIRYLDTDVLWLDKLADEGGRPWLNPYSKKAVSYLTRIIGEISDFDVSGVILESVCFPVSENLSSAGFPGEKSPSGRNSVLLGTVKSLRAALPEERFLLFSESSEDLLEQKSGERYYGSMLKANVNGFCADTLIRPSEFTVDRESRFSSMLSMFTLLKQRIGENKHTVLKIDMSEYSYKYIKQIKQNGFNSFILFDESGEY